LHRTIPSIRRFAALKDTTTISLENFVTDFFDKWCYGDLLLMVDVNNKDNDLLYMVATALLTPSNRFGSRSQSSEILDSAVALLRNFHQPNLSFRRPPSFAQSAVRPPDFHSRKIMLFELASLIDTLWELDSGSGDEQASSASDGENGVEDVFFDHIGEGGVEAATGANERTGTLSQCESCFSSSCRIRDSKTCRFRQWQLTLPRCQRCNMHLQPQYDQRYRGDSPRLTKVAQQWCSCPAAASMPSAPKLQLRHLVGSASSRAPPKKSKEPVT
jgi:hypothetical protein